VKFSVVAPTAVLFAVLGAQAPAPAVTGTYDIKTATPFVSVTEQSFKGASSAQCNESIVSSPVNGYDARVIRLPAADQNQSIEVSWNVTPGTGNNQSTGILGGGLFADVYGANCAQSISTASGGNSPKAFRIGVPAGGTWLIVKANNVYGVTFSLRTV
jgi:hypothetical protein